MYGNIAVPILNNKNTHEVFLSHRYVFVKVVH